MRNQGITDLLYEVGENERAHHRVGVALVAIPGVLVGLHLAGVGAIGIATDRG